jgi:hypothetical protein
MQGLALQTGESRLVTVAELLTCSFLIPPFQRPYDWEDEHVKAFISDVTECARKRTPLFLGLVVVSPGVDGRWSIIDGQQRLTTLMIAIAARGGSQSVVRSNSAGLSTPWITPRLADIDFTRALLRGESARSDTRSQRLLKEAFDYLTQAEPAFALQALLETQVILYVSPTLAGATRLFERINLRGKNVSQFDLVKNKLIDWAGVVSEPQARLELEAFITRQYDELYRLLDVETTAEALDSDKLLRVHWILFADKRTKSDDKPLDQVEQALRAVSENRGDVCKWIENYLHDLVLVAQTWIVVERPYENCPSRFSSSLKSALLDFARLNREGAFQPLIVASIIRWGDEAEKLVRMCEISSFRSALARRNGNQGRSYNWRVARQTYQRQWKDARNANVSSVEDAVHQLFWSVTPFWSAAEASQLSSPLNREEIAAQVFPDDALLSGSFYKQYLRVIHYLFFKYGRFLPLSTKWRQYVKEDMPSLRDDVWFAKEKRDSFKAWDIEHIYPQNPRDRDTPSGRAHMKSMAEYLHHLGNLTVLPIRDNRAFQNVQFAGPAGKLVWLRKQRKVSFNELLDERDYRGNGNSNGHWSDNNCRKRAANIQATAQELWGYSAIARLGVGPIDGRCVSTLDVEHDDDDEGGEEVAA